MAVQVEVDLGGVGEEVEGEDGGGVAWFEGVFGGCEKKGRLRLNGNEEEVVVVMDSGIVMVRCGFRPSRDGCGVVGRFGVEM